MAETVTLDLSKLESALKEWAAWVKDDASKVYADEARLLFKDGMDFTPPFGSGRRKGSTNKAKQQGEGEIRRQVLMTMTPLHEFKQSSPWLLRAIRSADPVNAVNEYWQKSGVPWQQAHASPFDSTYHKRNRNPYTGRVDKFEGRFLVTKSDQAALQEYIGQKQQNAGIHKAAWAHFVKRLNPWGTAQSRVPRWVERHTGKAQYLVTGDRVLIKPGEVNIRAVVLSHRATVEGYRRAVDMRKRALEKKVRMVMDGKADKINHKYSGLHR